MKVQGLVWALIFNAINNRIVGHFYRSDLGRKLGISGENDNNIAKAVKEGKYSVARAPFDIGESSAVFCSLILIAKLLKLLKLLKSISGNQDPLKLAILRYCRNFNSGNLCQDEADFSNRVCSILPTCKGPILMIIS